MALVLEGEEKKPKKKSALTEIAKVAECIVAPVCTPIITPISASAWDAYRSNTLIQPQEPKKTVLDTMPNTHVDALVFDRSVSIEQIEKFKESLKPAKPIIANNVTFEVRAGSPVTITFRDFKLDIPVDDMSEMARTMWAFDSSQVVTFRGHIRRHEDYEILERVGANHEYDPNQTRPAQTFIPSLETIMDDTRRLKKKYDNWITFEEKTGHWNKTVTKAMNGDQRAISKMQKLGDRAVCIMGTAWGGDNWGPKGELCSACEHLGNDMLRMFTEPTMDHGYYPRVMERFEEYKMIFEWHWNTSHRTQ